MTKYLNGRFSVGAPSNENYANNYVETFGVRKRDDECSRCEGRGQVEGVECVRCEGTGRAAYVKLPTFDLTDDAS